MKLRPQLKRGLSPEVFKNCYWDRKEMADFCRQEGLSTSGLKEDVTCRIAEYLENGSRAGPVAAKRARTGPPDSSKPLKLTTPVVNYKNDAKTREFFQQHCGPNFRFNSYLRQFAKGVPAGESPTYGDLIQGWRAAEDQRAKGSSEIGKQFEYNQFSRDYFAEEPDGTRKGMMEAWAEVRAIQGPNTYAFYKKATKKRKT